MQALVITIIKLAELDKNIKFSKSRIVGNQLKNNLKLKLVFELVPDNSRHRKYDILVKLSELDDSDEAKLPLKVSGNRSKTRLKLTRLH